MKNIITNTKTRRGKNKKDIITMSWNLWKIAKKEQSQQLKKTEITKKPAQTA